MSTCEDCGATLTYHDAECFCSSCTNDYSVRMPVTNNELLYILSFVKSEKSSIKPSIKIMLNNEEHKHLINKIMHAMQKLNERN